MTAFIQILLFEGGVQLSILHGVVNLEGFCRFDLEAQLIRDWKDNDRVTLKD
jgi:hypothetical protein